MMIRPDYSVVIPIYNNEATLNELLARIDRVFNDEIDKDYELILIDDASCDGSWNMLKAQSRGNAPLRSIRLGSNIGQHRATLVGFQYCRAQRIITMDADLQHQPEDIPRLIAGLSDQVDVVIARFHDPETTWWRQSGTSLVDGLLTVLYGKPGALRITSFKVFQGPIVDQLRKCVDYEGYLAGWMLKYQDHRGIINVNVDHKPRPSGKSSYKIWKLFSLAMKIVEQAIRGPKMARPYEIVEMVGFSS